MTQDNIRALDQLRQRLSQLSTSISSLRADLERHEPLPSWPSLQSSAQALSFNLQQLMETFNGHRQFLKEAHAYPLTNFPGRTQEDLLGQLLRKKLEPGVEDWINGYTVKSEDASAHVNGVSAERGGNAMSNDAISELWKWAAPTSGAIVGPMLEDGGAFDDDYTIAERERGVENVVTGLKRNLSGEEDEDEDADDQMEDVVSTAEPSSADEKLGIDASAPAMPIEDVLRFMSTGIAPSNAQSNRKAVYM